ncbi:MAG: phosphate acetyltransferase [Culicoidibacterales bacterium]
MDLFTSMKKQITGKNIRMVFPEAKDLRVLKAVVRIASENLMTPLLIGDTKLIQEMALENRLDISGIQIFNPADYSEMDAMKEAFLEVRKGKATPEDAERLLLDMNYFGTMLIKMGLADGLVSGAIHSTADTVRPALQIIKMQPGVTKVSSMFYMQRAQTAYIFGDCAINISPDSQTLADTAFGCALAASKFGIENPKIAFLSFSTKGSAKDPSADRVAEAVKRFKIQHPEIEADGEFQFDAAFVPEVGQLKAPDSSVAGKANIFIFPSLDAGNIGYKIAQRLGGFEAIGPILLGLNAPINDLSRGCNEEDVYKLAIITAAQVRV